MTHKPHIAHYEGVWWSGCSCGWTDDIDHFSVRDAEAAYAQHESEAL